MKIEWGMIRLSDDTEGKWQMKMMMYKDADDDDDEDDDANDDSYSVNG
jgi:hypothetical protein